MSIDFPVAPAANQTHVEAGLAWRWTGGHWISASIAEAPSPPSTVVATGSLVLPAGFNGTIMVEQTGPVTITLPPTPTSGQQVTVKDANGQASTYPITIAGLIEGVSGMTISFAYGWVALSYAGTQWVQT